MLKDPSSLSFFFSLLTSPQVLVDTLNLSPPAKRKLLWEGEKSGFSCPPKPERKIYQLKPRFSTPSVMAYDGLCSFGPSTIKILLFFVQK